MKTDAERARDDERRRLEKLRRESKAYDDAVQTLTRCYSIYRLLVLLSRRFTWTLHGAVLFLNSYLQRI